MAYAYGGNVEVIEAALAALMRQDGWRYDEGGELVHDCTAPFLIRETHVGVETLRCVLCKKVFTQAAVPPPRFVPDLTP
jgi:hypothetical protein